MTKFKVGDKVRRTILADARTRTVLAVHREFVWLSRDPGDGHEWANLPPIGARAEDYEHVPTFFEPGKEYVRFSDWSIHAQERHVTERFECTVVEKGGSGQYIAFGHLTASAGGVDTWVTLSRYDHDKTGWKEAP